jgi:hypothetical protein
MVAEQERRESVRNARDVTGEIDLARGRFARALPPML